jgi:hypothetical protein
MRTFSIGLCGIVVFLAAATRGFSQDPSCEVQAKALTAAIGNVTARYEMKMKQLAKETEEDAKEIEDEADKNNKGGVAVKFKIQVGAVPKTIKMNVPEVTAVEKKISFDFPEVKSSQKTIVFNTFSIKMVNKVCGQVPECVTKTKRIKIAPGKYIDVPYVECHPKDVICSVPVPIKEEHRLTTNYPVVEKKRREMKMNVPQVRVKQQTFTFNVPTVKIVDITVENKKTEEKADSLKAHTDKDVAVALAEFQAEVNTTVIPKHAGLYKCFGDYLLETQRQTVSELDARIKGTETCIAELRNAKVPSNNDSLAEQERQRDELIRIRADVVTMFNDQIRANAEEQQKSLKELLTPIK